MGLFINFDKSGNSKVARNGSLKVQTGSECFGYMGIDFCTTRNHHKAFWNNFGFHFGTSPVGDFGPFGRRTEYIPPFGVGWYMAWKIHLVGKG